MQEPATRGRTCVRIHDFPDGGYIIVGDEENWASVVENSRCVEYVEPAGRWDARWKQIYRVLPRDLARYVYYFVRPVIVTARQ